MPWIIVSIIRLLVPLLIWPFPLVGSIFGIIADNLDVVFLDALGIDDFAFYNSFDKGLDTYMYAIQAITMTKWLNKKAKKIGWGLFIYRFVGAVLFEFTSWRPLLLIFPNVFVTFFVIYLIALKIFKTDLAATNRRLAIFLVAIAIPKLYQEYLFHVAQIPLYQILRPIVFFWQ